MNVGVVSILKKDKKIHKWMVSLQMPLRANFTSFWSFLDVPNGFPLRYPLGMEFMESKGQGG
jgi:hypothetical protein